MMYPGLTTPVWLDKMAAEKMKKVVNLLTCPICYELYKNPKYLPCYHSYCEECLEKLQKSADVTCPECRKTSTIPMGGIKQLPNNFFINRIIDEIALKEEVALKEKVAGENKGEAIEVDQQIDDYYEQLHRQLQQQREDLKKELHEVSTQKKKALSLQLEQMEGTQAQLESMKELNNGVKAGPDQEALFIKKQVTTDYYKKLDPKPVELATLQFIPVEKYQICFPRFAHLFYGDADHLNSTAENIPSLTYVNENINFKVVTKNAEGDLCTKGGSKVIAQVQSTSTKVVIPVTVKDNKDGSYSATFVANQTGELKLLVIINGKHIKGSPYTLTCRNYLALNVPSKVINDGGKMGKPWGVAFGEYGMWAVADQSNHCVCIFDSQDQLVRKFGSKGNGNGQFHYPAGLAFDDDDHLYVVCRYV